MAELFISDLHLGHKICKAGKLVHFLSNQDKSQTLYLVGDTIDDAASKPWPSVHRAVIAEILGFRKIIVIPGNHDSFLEAISNLFTDKISVIDGGCYFSGDKKYLVTHGHQDDPSLLLTAPRWLRRHWPMTGRMHTKTMTNFIMRRAVSAAKALGCDGVICGHTHHPDNRMVDGVHYLNCGDWFYSCTALIHKDGEFKLIKA